MNPEGIGHKNGVLGSPGAGYWWPEKEEAQREDVPPLASTQYPTSRTLSVRSIRHPLRRVTNELAGRAQIELLAHVTAMRIDGLHGQIEPLRDLARADAFADELEHFELAIRERGDGIFVLSRSSAACDLAQQTFAHGRAHMALTASDFAQCT